MVSLTHDRFVAWTVIATFWPCSAQEEKRASSMSAATGVSTSDPQLLTCLSLRWQLPGCSLQCSLPLQRTVFACSQDYHGELVCMSTGHVRLGQQRASAKFSPAAVRLEVKLIFFLVLRHSLPSAAFASVDSITVFVTPSSFEPR